MSTKKKKPVATAEAAAEAAAETAAETAAQEAPPTEELSEWAKHMLALEVQAKKNPLHVKSRVRLSATLMSGLEQLGNEAIAAGHLGENGNPMIDPDHLKAQVVFPMLQALSADLQELQLLTLEETIEALTFLWTGGPLDDMIKPSAQS